MFSQFILFSYYLLLFMIKEIKSESVILKYKWAESDPDFAGEVVVNWGRDGTCDVMAQQNMGEQNMGQQNMGQQSMGQQNMGGGYMQRRYLQQGYMQPQNITSGTCNDPTMDINVYDPNRGDSIGSGRTSWQYSPMDYGGCNSLNTLKLSLFPNGDQKSPQQFRLQVREMCCDKKCAENTLPNIDCLYGPPGKVLNWNTWWIDPCFNLPRNQTATALPQTPAPLPQTPAPLPQTPAPLAQTPAPQT